MKKFFAPFAAGVFASLVLGYSVTSSAGFEEESANLFNTMTNVTAPGAYKGASRGVITGGSIYQRNQITNARLVGVDFPSVSAGCGGIDVFGGSFSFISADQFVQLMRNIASNAGSYAFKLALDNLCPSCMSNIDKLQSALQKMNDATLNSCQIAKSGLDAIMAKPDGPKTEPGAFAAFIDKNIVGNVNTAAGFIRDPFKSQVNTADGANAGRIPPAATKDLVTKAVYGNITWTYLNDESYNPKSWTQFADTELANLIMSFTGTLVVFPPPTGAGNEDKAPNPYFVEPTLTFKELYEGSYRPDAPDQRLNKQPQVLNCPAWDQSRFLAGELQCTEQNQINPTDKVFVGFKTRISRLLTGYDGYPGLVDIYTQPTMSPDPKQKALLEIMPPYIGPMIRNISVSNKSAAPGFMVEAIEPFSVDTAAYLAYGLLNTLEAATRQQGLKQNPFAPQMDASIKKSKAEIQAYLVEQRARKSDSASIFALYKGVIALTPRDINMQPSPVAVSADGSAGGVQ